MAKQYDQQSFQISDTLTAFCHTEDTRYGFRHLAVLFKDGRVIGESKACYYNRTWERYTYESVLKVLVEKSNLSTNEREAFRNYIAGYRDPRLDDLKMIAGIAKLGEFFGSNQKESNDWKARMLKAGLENRGLEMPDDWDQLSEDEKESRLNKVIAELSTPL